MQPIENIFLVVPPNIKVLAVAGTYSSPDDRKIYYLRKLGVYLQFNPFH
jgi:hypothetical protein